MLNSNRIARLQAKFDHIRVTLGDSPVGIADAGAGGATAGMGSGGADGEGVGVLTLTRRPNISRRRRIGKNTRHGGGEP